MQLSYIDDRRMALYGKVTIFLDVEPYLNPVGVIKAITSFVCFFFLSFQAFGGYLSLKMLAATDKLFQCTAAVAPITDFRLYSKLNIILFTAYIIKSLKCEAVDPLLQCCFFSGAAFSERYLGLPAKEEHAYLVRLTILQVFCVFM